MHENLKRIAQEVWKGQTPPKARPYPQREIPEGFPVGPELLTREGWNKLQAFMRYPKKLPD